MSYKLRPTTWPVCSLMVRSITSHYASNRSEIFCSSNNGLMKDASPMIRLSTGPYSDSIWLGEKWMGLPRCRGRLSQTAAVSPRGGLMREDASSHHNYYTILFGRQSQITGAPHTKPGAARAETVGPCTIARTRYHL